MFRRPLAACFIVAIVAACGPLPSDWEIAVQNNSSSAVVAGGNDPIMGGYHFFAVRPGATVVVDTIGHENPPIQSLLLFDAACSPLPTVTGDFWSGATVLINADRSTSVQTPRRPTQPANDGQSTCQAAAAQL